MLRVPHLAETPAQTLVVLRGGWWRPASVQKPPTGVYGMPAADDWQHALPHGNIRAHNLGVVFQENANLAQPRTAVGSDSICSNAHTNTHTHTVPVYYCGIEFKALL